MPNCTKCKTQFQISKEDEDFYKKISPKIGDKKIEIPPPALCHNCRAQRRMAWRNDRKLYERKCDQTGQRIISLFRPNSKIKVIHKDIWYSDDWDGKKYGRDFDFSKTFFEQFDDLLKTVPLLHIMINNDENSLYTNYTYANKNCYLCFAGNFLEDSMYCYNAENSRDCLDCLFIFDSELCYECVHSTNCYNLTYSIHCRSCKDSSFLEDCTNCSNCFMCWGLTNQEYCYMNKKYSKEEYEKIPKEISIEKWNEERKKFHKPRNHNISAENCTGEYILNSKNCQECYIMDKNCEDCKYIINGFPGLKDSMDCTYCGEKTSLLYECTATGMDCYNIAFCNLAFVNAHNIYYSYLITKSKNCFGCISMRGEEYCILNKQYTKEQYEKLVPKIIEHMKEKGEWGEFFPAHLSPFGYNETIANEYFPLQKEQAIKENFTWIDEKQIKKLENMLECNQCKKNFKITKQEVEFYEKMKLAKPTNCFDCRHTLRLSIRSPYKQNYQFTQTK